MDVLQTKQQFIGVPCVNVALDWILLEATNAGTITKAVADLGQHWRFTLLPQGLVDPSNACDHIFLRA